MTKTLKRIAPLQLAKILGVAYGAIGLIFIPFFVIAAVIGSMIPGEPGIPTAAISLTFGILMSIALPAFYGISGFVFGLIGAWFYNLIAKWIGGIQVEVE